MAAAGAVPLIKQFPVLNFTPENLPENIEAVFTYLLERHNRSATELELICGYDGIIGTYLHFLAFNKLSLKNIEYRYKRIYQELEKSWFNDISLAEYNNLQIALLNILENMAAADFATRFKALKALNKVCLRHAELFTDVHILSKFIGTLAHAHGFMGSQDFEPTLSSWAHVFKLKNQKVLNLQQVVFSLNDISAKYLDTFIKAANINELYFNETRYHITDESAVLLANIGSAQLKSLHIRLRCPEMTFNIFLNALKGHSVTMLDCNGYDTPLENIFKQLKGSNVSKLNKSIYFMTFESLNNCLDFIPYSPIDEVTDISEIGSINAIHVFVNKLIYTMKKYPLSRNLINKLLNCRIEYHEDKIHENIKDPFIQYYNRLFDLMPENQERMSEIGNSLQDPLLPDLTYLVGEYAADVPDTSDLELASPDKAIHFKAMSEVIHWHKERIEEYVSSEKSSKIKRKNQS